VERLFKVFGPQPEEVVRKLQEGADPEEVRASGATPAVVDADFDVREGETFVVMGLSGSGKSTLIRMFNGLLTPTSGKVCIDDENITGMSPKDLRAMRQRKMSMVFQHFALFPHRSVLDNAGYGLQVQGLPRDEIEAKAREALEMVGLGGWENRYPQQLSGGMRQRVGLARALAAGTDVLLMDEAFSALDPLIKREMQDQLLALQAQLGKTIIFITHDLNEAMRLGDRIAVMRAGRIVQLGTAEEILNQPADDYVAKFVQDVDRSRVLTAGAIATPRPTVDAEATTDAALRMMRDNEVDELFVVDASQRPLGVVTSSMVAAQPKNGLDRMRAVMKPLPEPVADETPLQNLFHHMAENSAALPVVDREQRMVGVITTENLFGSLSFHQAPEANGSARSAAEPGESVATKEASSSDA
jgi:glycine betaine/proline transport system ATP-binding protein